MRLFPVVSIIALVASGCAGTFGGEHGPTLGAAMSPEMAKRCDSIDTLRIVFGGATLILGATAGGSGITAWRLRSDGAKDAMTITAGIAGLLAVGTGYAWNEKSKQWEREGCAS